MPEAIALHKQIAQFLTTELAVYSQAKMDDMRESQMAEVDRNVRETVQRLAKSEKEIQARIIQNEMMKMEQARQERENEARREQQEKAEAEAAASRARAEAEQARKDQGKQLVQSVNENDQQGINQKQTLSRYAATAQTLSQFRKETEETFGADASLKTYRFDLQKAINFPLNSLLEDKGGEASENRRNFGEKIKTLVRLLSGQTCTITSTLTVNPSKHRRAIDYCLVYLARKLVEKGEESVGNRPETAFQYGQVVVEVMKQMRSFEVILFGQMSEKCPYVVPYYKQRVAGQTHEQFME